MGNYATEKKRAQRKRHKLRKLETAEVHRIMGSPDKEQAYAQADTINRDLMKAWCR